MKQFLVQINIQNKLIFLTYMNTKASTPILKKQFSTFYTFKFNNMFYASDEPNIGVLAAMFSGRSPMVSRYELNNRK